MAAGGAWCSYASLLNAEQTHTWSHCSYKQKWTTLFCCDLSLKLDFEAFQLQSAP